MDKAYTLPNLPYDYAALEPHYSARLLALHHDKHHAAYVAGANTTLEKLAEAREKNDFAAINQLQKNLRLTWDDIDWDDGVIVPGGGRKKTQGVRQIAPLTETVRTILEEIKQDRKRSKVENIAGTGLVFVRDDGRPISGNAITKVLHKACKRAKVRNFRFHDTRHTAKTEWARKGIPVEAAMLAAGHSSIQMHQAYVHLQKSDISKAFGTSKFYNDFKTDSEASIKD
jgi:site-specific recombinase XerC